MTKEITQDRLRESLKQQSLYMWFMRVQVIRTEVPGDFMISTTKVNIGPENKYDGTRVDTPITAFIECKQVTLEHQCKLNYKRLTQMQSLLSFANKAQHHRSYFLINFWNGRADSSNAFLIPARQLYDYVEVHKFEKLFVTESEMLAAFPQYLLKLNGKYWDIHGAL